MAIYHFSVKIISRANGSSALASAAYRSASRLHDERLDRAHDFSNKAGVIHSEVILPDGAPEDWRDREKLWNAVEAAEKRKDAQLAREVEFAIPREMSQAQGIDLARDFVADQFVSGGMTADLNVHWDIGSDGMPKPHAHVMLAMREVGEDGFGAKVRDWNRTGHIEQWREAWATHVNQRLAELDIDAAIDHRSLEAQGIDLEPQNKIGPAASRMADIRLEMERIAEHRAIAQRNGEKIIAHPALALEAITHGQATFTRRDLAMFVHRHSDRKEQFDRAMAAVEASPNLISLGKDGRGEDRFTSRAMIDAEQRLQQASLALADRHDHAVSAQAREHALMRASTRGMILSAEQQSAFDHVTQDNGLGVVIGYAGTGKSVMLGVAKEAWEESGFRVQGLALSGIAAENLESGSGIAARTITGQEHQWAQGRDLPSSSDVFVIDEAGMVGTRQLERLLSRIRTAGAKIALVGDPQQLQAIEAGAAFRSLVERHGGVEITDIRRQRDDWQRDATRHLATGRTGEAVRAYAEREMVHEATSREAARSALIDRWDDRRKADPNGSRIILTHTKDEVRLLNDAARDRLRTHGDLGQDVGIRTKGGERNFAAGDRVMFLRNERSPGVKNGSLGRIENLTAMRMAVLLDDGRNIVFDIKDYAHVDHGYAATIHKAQGMTVDRTHILATPGFDSHAAYVALSRHRHGIDLHYGHDDFADSSKLVRTLSRERPKDMAQDYERQFAEHRGIRFGARVREAVEKVKSIFAGFRPSPRLEPLPHDKGAELSRDMIGQRKAVERYARALVAMDRMQEKGLPVLAHQRHELERTGASLDHVRPHARQDLQSAFSREPRLIHEAASGRSQQALTAMALEEDVRTDPAMRADRFVQNWAVLRRQREELERAGDERGMRRVSQSMAGMAKSLERDPQLDSILRNRRIALGMAARSEGGISFSDELTETVGLPHTRHRGLSL